MIHTFSSTIRRKEMDAVLTCMVDEKIGPGDIGKRLVQTAVEFFGVEGALALRSPALALSAALAMHSLEEGTQVMLSALAPAWQFRVVELDPRGLKPLVLDVSPESAQLTAEIVAAGIQAGGRILVLHEALGNLPDMDALFALGIPIIEDISESAGAMYGGKKAGTFGDFAILGLEEHDLVTGGGGALLLASSSRNRAALKNFAEKLFPTDVLPDINSALAFVQIKEFPRNESRRRELYDLYAAHLAQGRHKLLSQSGELPDDSSLTAYAFPVVLSSGFKDVKQYAAKKEIEIASAFESSIAAYLGDDFDAKLGVFPQAKSLLLRTALFPLYPRLQNTDAEKICRVLASLP